MRAIGAVLSNLFLTSDEDNTATVLHGLSVNEGMYEGTARLVDDAADFGRIQQGDVLVTRNTSPYFNVVLPLLGAIVTDRGGQLSHAAIVAREYGIPGVVGTREATTTIPDGARVRVDGTTGEVHVLTVP
jgi:phosphoenolpyruvate synthase/pyruvate phosphate dikinase